MLKELKRQSIKKGLRAVFTGVIISAMLLVVGSNFYREANKEKIPFQDLTRETLREGQYVELAITENLGSYMQEYEQRKGLSVKKYTDVFYFLAFDADTKPQVISVSVPKEYKAAMDKIADNTLNGEKSEPFHMVGHVVRMNSEEYSYAATALRYLGIDSISTSDVMPRCHIEYVDMEAMTTLSTIFLVSGAISVAVTVCLFLYTLSGLRMRKIKKEVEALGYSMDAVEQEYKSARVVERNPIFRISSTFTFFYTGATPHILINKDIIIASHFHVVEKGRGGLIRRTTYFVKILTMQGKIYKAQVPKENNAEYILNIMRKAMPWIVVCTDDAFYRAYKKDPAAFLDMRYNKIDKITNTMV